MGLISTLIYTSELILCSTNKIYVPFLTIFLGQVEILMINELKIFNTAALCGIEILHSLLVNSCR